MKKCFALVSFLLFAFWGVLRAQTYWVFLADKEGSSFDPYSYFDPQAVSRYAQNGMDLYDIANYPVSPAYSAEVARIASETLGCSRWLNAVAVVASPEQVGAIEQLPFVLRTLRIGEAPMMPAGVAHRATSADAPTTGGGAGDESVSLMPQLVRMEGERFAEAGFDGRGLRIAVFDGGFPRVNSHAAFQHLRDNNLIVDTWNFPNDDADVYGWNSHGLMTLSCITGRMGGRQLGLATGAEFLLYRTEVNTEPAKEEVWWQMAVERADQHGANIISSSLGYGKERYRTQDMDGTSLIAKAADMAARRGILVVNSAGNENTSAQWRTIITPADAESVLTVGGIEDKLTEYRPISFSSCGPTADGRLKPEVAAFGRACVASPDDDEALTWASGTSFSCPLVAGFAACAWQASPGKTALEMKQEIEHSADRYPYFDYALGYGVPQAGYFADKERATSAPTFRFEEADDSVAVCLVKRVCRVTVFFNKQRPDGTLAEYGSRQWITSAQHEGRILFAKASIDSCTLNLFYEGYGASYRLSPEERQRFAHNGAPFKPHAVMPESEPEFATLDHGTPKRPSDFGTCAIWWGGPYWQFGSMICLGGKEQNIRFSPVNHLGLRLMRAFSKSYKLGVGIEWAMANYHLDGEQCNPLDEMLGTPADDYVVKKYMKQGDWALELFQRVRLIPGGLAGNGLYWDLGLYGSISYYNYHVKSDYGGVARPPFELADIRIKNPDYRDRYWLNWGITTRVMFDVVGIYFRYRLTGVFDNQSLPDVPGPGDFYLNLPRFEAGLMLSF